MFYMYKFFRLSWADFDIRYRADISQKNKYWIISNFTLNLQYELFDKKLSILFQRFCPIPIGDSASDHNKAGGHTTVAVLSLDLSF